MTEKPLEVIKNKEYQSGANNISNPYNRLKNDYAPSESKKSNMNILKNVGEELIVSSERSRLTNKRSHKSIFIPNSNSSKRMKVYDPYLINVCKRAIIREKKELPHFREIIKNINTEFGIKETKKEMYEMNEDSRIKTEKVMPINDEMNNKIKK